MGYQYGIEVMDRSLAGAVQPQHNDFDRNCGFDQLVMILSLVSCLIVPRPGGITGVI